MKISKFLNLLSKYAIVASISLSCCNANVFAADAEAASSTSSSTKVENKTESNNQSVNVADVKTYSPIRTDESFFKKIFKKKDLTIQNQESFMSGVSARITVGYNLLASNYLNITTNNGGGGAVQNYKNSLELKTGSGLNYEISAQKEFAGFMTAGLSFGYQPAFKVKRKCDNVEAYEVSGYKAMIETTINQKYNNLNSYLFLGAGLAMINLNDTLSTDAPPESCMNNKLRSTMDTQSNLNPPMFKMLPDTSKKNTIGLYSVGAGVDYEFSEAMSFGLSYKFTNSLKSTNFYTDSSNKLKYTNGLESPNIEYQYGTHNIGLSLKLKA